MTNSRRLGRERVLEVLSRVCDPETQMSITRAGQLDSLEVCEDGSVEVSFHPVSPYTPLVFVAKLALDIATALRSLEGIRVFKVTVSGHSLHDYVNRTLDKVFAPHETK
jgi:metal-sulfur cluster biosynthetic enzyme